MKTVRPALSRLLRSMICFNSLVAVLVVALLFVYPAVRAALDIVDPALQRPGVPKAAWRLYRNLTPRYAEWAKERVTQGEAATLSLNDISGTEWPLFGSVFYLWGIENLQTAWDAGDRTGDIEPKVFAKEAIIAASELVIDPNHASWVKKHWGEDYLHKENVFYRMLVMAALTSREKLLHDDAHLDLLRDQVETFVKELDASKTGLLDDYPGQCYPADVMAAILCIKRADVALGTDHSAFIKRAVRGFTGNNATRHHLPPYAASSMTGIPESEARGCANSYMCFIAPELWPAQARQWFALHDKFFFQERITAVGYRELPVNTPNSEWAMDVDSGPVIAGHGVAASAFGIGAARKNGRFDRAYPIAAEMLATVGELPNGVLAIPRLLSNFSDAPMLGESAILWQLSIQPEKGFAVKTGGKIPLYVKIVLGTLLLFGIWRILTALWTFREARRTLEPMVWAPRFQVFAWVCLMLGTVTAFAVGHEIIGVVVLIIGVMLPVMKKERTPKGTEDWPDLKPSEPDQRVGRGQKPLHSAR